MKYPLNWYHDAIRQLTCTLVGHKCKSGGWVLRSEYKNVDLQTIDYDSLSYKERCGPNPYYHHISSWRFKCRRCRSRYRDWPTESIIVDTCHSIWWAAKNSKIVFEVAMFDSKSKHRFWVAPTLSIISFVSNYFLLQQSSWSWPSTLLSPLEEKLFKILEPIS